MTDNYDVIVLGAGSAGICAAAELTLQGARVLLVAESKEVGYQFRSVWMGESRAVVIAPSRNLYGEGGYWFTLARKLGVSVKYLMSCPGVAFTQHRSGEIFDVPYCASGTAIADIIAAMSPVPLGDSQATLERLLNTGMNIPPQELAGMQEVPFMEWLEKEGTDEITTGMLLTIGSNLTYLETEQAAAHLSVFGMFAPLRSYMGGDTVLCAIQPDAREGLWIPMAKAIEARGATIWRSGKVTEISVSSSGVATGIVLADGREATAPVIASTFGVGRLKAVLKPVPDEVSDVAAFEASQGDLREYTTFAVTERVTDNHPGRLIASVFEDGSFAQVDWNISALSPWCTPPGTQIIGSEVVRSRASVEAMGGLAALHEEMKQTCETNYPGYLESMVTFESLDHPQLCTAFLTGPKLPRRSRAIENLWHVGEASQPIDGCYVEGASSAGVLGARAIAAELRH